MHSLSFEAVPDYASLSGVLSKLNLPTNETIIDLKTSAKQHLARETIKEVIESKIHTLRKRKYDVLIKARSQLEYNVRQLIQKVETGKNDKSIDPS